MHAQRYDIRTETAPENFTTPQRSEPSPTLTLDPMTHAVAEAIAVPLLGQPHVYSANIGICMVDSATTMPHDHTQYLSTALTVKIYCSRKNPLGLRADATPMLDAHSIEPCVTPTQSGHS